MHGQTARHQLAWTEPAASAQASSGFLVTSVLSFLLNYRQSRKIQPGLSWHEIVIVLKVIMISILTVLLGQQLQETFHLDGFKSFLLIPVLIFTFFGIASLMNVSNVIRDTKIVLDLFRK